MKGRKRHVVVDTLGLLRGLLVTGGDVQDRDGAKALLKRLKGRLGHIRKIWADGAYAGKLVAWAERALGIDLEIVKRKEGEKGFSPIPRRWVVERTFGWLNPYRLLAKEYEQTVESSEADIYLAMTRTMLRRLAP
mgnify:FL=1